MEVACKKRLMYQYYPSLLLQLPTPRLSELMVMDAYDGEGKTTLSYADAVVTRGTSRRRIADMDYRRPLCISS